MPYKLDIVNWNRKNTFDYYKNFESPFFNITANVDVTAMQQFCKQEKHSFFLTSLYYSTKVCNEIENFRYRLQEEAVVVYEQIHFGSAILFEDHTFGFAYFEMQENFRDFLEQGTKILEQAKEKNTFAPKASTDNLIHYSVIPWVAFTNFQHARQLPVLDSIPKIVFGKIFEQGERKLMPISVEVHHALIDGWHVGQYFEKMNQLTFE